MVTGDEPTVWFAEAVELRNPLVHLVPALDEQRDGVESRQRLGAVRVVAQGDLWLAALPSQADTSDEAVFDELDRGLKT